MQIISLQAFIVLLTAGMARNSLCVTCSLFSDCIHGKGSKKETEQSDRYIYFL